MEIRLCTIDDYPSIYALWMATPGMGLNDIDDSEAGITQFLNRNPNTCFVALIDNEVVGVILAGHDGRRALIYHLAVSLDHRNKGIGTALVEKTMAALRDEGIKKVALVVFKKNEIGNAFWTSLGFDARDDLVYRNKALAELQRIDT